MTTAILLAIILGALAVIALVTAVVFWLRQGRSRQIRGFAARHGLSYMGGTWVLGDCDFPLFRKGEKRRWDNVMSGAWNGTTLVYADYEFDEHDGRTGQSYVFSVVVTDLGCSMPVVEVTARAEAGKLTEELGVRGIEFPSPQLNERFVIESEDESFAFEIIEPRMIDVLLNAPPGLHVQFGPNRMVVWGHRRNVSELQPLLDAAAALDQRVPVVVRQEPILPAVAASGGSAS